MSDTDDVPPRVLAAEQRRRTRQAVEAVFGCPFDPQCGAMLVDHPKDGWDSRGDAINPRCPEAT